MKKGRPITPTCWLPRPLDMHTRLPESLAVFQGAMYSFPGILYNPKNFLAAKELLTQSVLPKA